MDYKHFVDLHCMEVDPLGNTLEVATEDKFPGGRCSHCHNIQMTGKYYCIQFRINGLVVSSS